MKDYLNINIFESAENPTMFSNLMNIRQQLAYASQSVYDNWEQDSQGVDEMYGAGGICDDIAEQIATTISDLTPYDTFTLYNEYDTHTSAYAFHIASKSLYKVDIPPYVYETGYGYNWNKKKNVIFNPAHFVIEPMEYDMFIDESGNPIQS